MGEFSADWLALREPADHRSRSATLTRAVLATLPRDRPVSVLDLACGTGSNYRYIEATLKGSRHDGGGASYPQPLDWLLVDRDPELLARVPVSRNIEARRLDLTTLDGDLARGRALVTASALLDLVSDEWLRQLADQCRTYRAAALFALTYDGRIACHPAEAMDGRIRDLVNRHQLTDKGFGPALGPAAAAAAAAHFTRAGFEVRRERTDWVLTAADGGVQIPLINGWAAAARGMAPAETEAIVFWQARRLAHVAAGTSTIRVGHEDLAATK